MHLTQSEADYLRGIPKACDSTDKIELFQIDKPIIIPATSLDGTEKFLVDISRCVIILSKWKYQERARRSIPLMRLDINDTDHKNPEIAQDERTRLQNTFGWPFERKLGKTHLHIYIEGYGPRWAFPLSIFPKMQEAVESLGEVAYRRLLAEFLKLCNFQPIPSIITDL